jgi:hypothetical protein
LADDVDDEDDDDDGKQGKTTLRHFHFSGRCNNTKPKLSTGDTWHNKLQVHDRQGALICKLVIPFWRLSTTFACVHCPTARAKFP